MSTMQSACNACGAPVELVFDMNYIGRDGKRGAFVLAGHSCPQCKTMFSDSFSAEFMEAKKKVRQQADPRITNDSLGKALAKHG